MKRRPTVIHVVEKDPINQNLRCVNHELSEWETAYWVIGKKTAPALIGGLVYVHRGQNLSSHIGGTIIDIYHEEGSEAKRRVIRFKSHPKYKGLISPRSGWANEKKIEWLEVS